MNVVFISPHFPPHFVHFVTALREEQECLAHFGEAYQDYMRRTRRFVPFLL